ncbi:hypothetical protein [Streptosporangium lutulentum]|uniref:MFS transporter n=1 Tax=Streptosporangium lutulentum TaxID=1461250 RepID=A0ABT9Q6I3_9ACTN|nr:hypothetical protein [Streptosporangium lutulentum]MDP9842370.1 hypothetical protein [Streptosporangium lutulentum]
MTLAASALRVPRAVVFATLCVVVSAGGHVLAGGGPVPPRLVALGAAIAFCVAYALNGRERGADVVLAATVGAQILLHELFGRAAPAPHLTVAADHAHPGWGMAAVHLVVALGTGWWLHRGESALWFMIRLYGGRMPVIRLRLACAAEVTPPAWQAVPAAGVRPYGGWEILPVLRRRGPPASRPTG